MDDIYEPILVIALFFFGLIVGAIVVICSDSLYTARGIQSACYELKVEGCEEVVEFLESRDN